MKKDKTLEKKGHGGREDLAGEHTLGDMGQLILLLIFLIVWVADSFFIKYSTFISNYVYLYIRIPLSVIFLIASGYLASSGLKIVFGEVREQPGVIQKGVFRLVRHPIYLSSILLYFALLMFSFSIISTVIWIVIIAFYIYISRHEEKLLIEKFGKEYEEYMKDVPMLIPRLKR